MSIITCILIVVLIIFLICAIVGCLRFLSDTRKFSSYYNELQNLKEKAEKKYGLDETEEGEEVNCE